MESNPFVRRVNVERLEPLAGLHHLPEAAGHDESPPCPGCGREALWFVDCPKAPVELVCVECASAYPARGPAGSGRPEGRCTNTAEQLTRQVRGYGDEHFPGWREIAVRIRMGEPGGEVVLVLARQLAPPESAELQPTIRPPAAI